MAFDHDVVVIGSGFGGAATACRLAELHVLPNYGHQDVFMGKNRGADIFPRLTEFMNKHRNGALG